MTEIELPPHTVADVIPKPAKRQLADLYMDGEDIFHLPPIKWLVEGLIQADGLSVIYGPPKEGKTFVGLDLALRISNGLPWRDLKVEQTRVLYMVGEGLSGIKPRIRAWIDRFGGDLSNFGWLRGVPNLLESFSEESSEAQQVADLAVAKGVGLIIFDTLARSTPGLEENSARDMGLVIQNLDWIKEHTGAAVLACHHTGKDTSRGMRGSNALQGAVDSSIQVSRNGDLITATLVDQKNAESGQQWHWRGEKEAESIVLVPTADTSSSVTGIENLNLLKKLSLIDTGGGVASGAWEAASSEIVKSTAFRERKKQLLDAGLIQNRGTAGRPLWALTPDGQFQLESLGE